MKRKAGPVFTYDDDSQEEVIPDYSSQITRGQALALLKGFLLNPIPKELHEQIASACEANQTNVVHEAHIAMKTHSKCPCHKCS